MDTIVSTPRSVLCADHDPAVHRMVTELLAGCETMPVANAFEALRAVNSKSFDLYVLDYWLPDLSGVQLCREIRKVDPRGPILFCTAAGRDEDRRRALRAGANAYLLKPLDPARFTRQARIALELGDLESLRAKVEEERAVQDELARLGEIAKARSISARDATQHALRRTARAKAMKAFVESGGTRANFERWWPQLSDSISSRFAGGPRP
jgi:CheY-like chemotaxis protein